MAEMIFKECCPCGNSVDISSYRSEVQQQIQSWRSLHNKHANMIAKAVAENKAHPPYYFWPYTSAVGSNGVFSYSTSMPGSGAIKAKEKSPGE